MLGWVLWMDGCMHACRHACSDHVAFFFLDVWLLPPFRRRLLCTDLSKEDREMLEMENMALQDELESELEALLKIEEDLVKVTSMCEVASHKIQEQVPVNLFCQCVRE